jgi:hypothetical protein
MKKTNYLGLAFSLLFIIFLFNTTAFAQSTDPDNPTVLEKREMQGKNTGDDNATYYYTFTAGPGSVKITTDLKHAFSSGRFAVMDWILLDSNFKEIKRVNSISEEARNIQEVELTKKQKVILKLVVGLNTGNFKIQLDGAVNFAGGKSSSNEDIPEITGDSTPKASQQFCMPRNGVMILTMEDGKKAKVDLSKVQKIEVQ